MLLQLSEVDVTIIIKKQNKHFLKNNNVHKVGLAKFNSCLRILESTPRTKISTQVFNSGGRRRDLK